MEELLENKKICPLCGSNNIKLIYKTTVEDTFSKMDNQDNLIKKELNKLWETGRCSFMECFDCSFSFALPFRSGTNKLYSLIYADNYPTDRWEYHLALDDIHPKDICLEIGSGSGMFLTKLLNRCKKENIYSVEISNDKGSWKDIKDIPNKKRFSIVCMFQVLEHLSNFKEVINKINKINKITTKNAKLLISVPHESSVEFFRKSIGIGDTPPIHVSRWNKKTIGRLKGWKIKKHKIKLLSNFEIFKNLFYGTRTVRYSGTHNPFLLIACLLNAITKMRFKKLVSSQHFYLEKNGK